MTREIVCPCCGECNAVTEEHETDMQVYGKAVLCCGNCDRLFVLRDDGDGEFVSSEGLPRLK